jgi:thioredoxin-like negative regulator of GroEL
MNGLLYLTSEDFNKTTQNGKNMMVHSITGFSLILFYSNHCKFCPEYTALFRMLPGSVSGCQFGILNVDSNKDFINHSKNTISQINYVPFILLYVNGVPFMKYNGPATIQELSRFIVEVSKNLQQRQKFSPDVVKKDPSGGIPAYTIGHPLKHMVCFLEFEEAYDSSGPSRRKK